MYSFFSRHEVDKRAEGFRPRQKGYPSAGRIALEDDGVVMEDLKS